MKICKGELVYITNAVNGTGRADHVARGIARAVAMEHMRLIKQNFHGYGRPTFAGRPIYRTIPRSNWAIVMSWRNRHFTLRIVAK